MSAYKNGFHLIELLIVLVIIGILASISLPIYHSYFVKANRLAAEEELLKLALAMEHYQETHNSYRDASLSNLNFPQYIVSGQYQLHIAFADDTDYLLQAEPLAEQASADVMCGKLSITANGAKLSEGKTAYCW